MAPGPDERVAGSRGRPGRDRRPAPAAGGVGGAPRRRGRCDRCPLRRHLGGSFGSAAPASSGSSWGLDRRPAGSGSPNRAGRLRSRRCGGPFRRPVPPTARLGITYRSTAAPLRRRREGGAPAAGARRRSPSGRSASIIRAADQSAPAGRLRGRPPWRWSSAMAATTVGQLTLQRQLAQSGAPRPDVAADGRSLGRSEQSVRRPR